MITNKKILIIDDQQDFLDTIRDLVEMHFSDIETATTVAKATDLASQIKYDCIIVDLNIKGINGANAIHKLQAQADNINKDTPVVVVSGNLDDRETAEHYSSLFSAVLKKPFDPDDLISVLKSIMNV